MSDPVVGAVPEITPVLVFRLTPDGKAPAETLYVIVPESGSDATIVTLIDAPSSTLAIVAPAACDENVTGPSIVIKSVFNATPPSGFSTLTS